MRVRRGRDGREPGLPWVSPSTIAAVADALKGGAEIVAPAYRGERGHPVGFARSYGRVLSTLGGDEGARNVIAARLWALTLVEVDDQGVIQDVDLPSDLP
jgi:molybdenum cofactor cytidylyltransferase